ncbi:ATP-binding region, ATPase-like domain protein, partial [mine drainage metagenome]
MMTSASCSEKFYQAQKRPQLVKQDGAGTGLGLAISKDIVRLHGGKIYFDSKLGHGSKFSFTLPISKK